MYATGRFQKTNGRPLSLQILLILQNQKGMGTSPDLHRGGAYNKHQIKASVAHETTSHSPYDDPALHKVQAHVNCPVNTVPYSPRAREITSAYQRRTTV